MIRRVSGHSMVPVLPPGTYIVGLKWFRKLRIGDVIVFLHDGKEKIKRLERFEDDGSLYVLGEYPDTSTDSRHFGGVEPRTVRAKVIWPGVHLKRG